MEVIRNILIFLFLIRKKALVLACGVIIAYYSTGYRSFLENETLPEEYQVKAVFLFNFIQFVQWPETSFSGKESPFVIGVLGKDPFGVYLQELVRGEAPYDRPIVVMKYDRLQEIGNCHILYIGESDRGELKKVLSTLANKSILTVGDMNGFGQLGGMTEFVKRENKIKLKINQEAAKSAGLEISSKLLRLAEIVSTENSQ